MTTYALPLREMLFAMKEYGGLDAVLARTGNEEVTDELVEGDPRRTVEVRIQRAGANQRSGRHPGLLLARPCRDRGRWLQAGLRELLRDWLERHAGGDRIRRAGHADAQF
jgi:hypothetical protein